MKNIYEQCVTILYIEMSYQSDAYDDEIVFTTEEAHIIVIECWSRYPKQDLMDAIKLVLKDTHLTTYDDFYTIRGERSDGSVAQSTFQLIPDGDDEDIYERLGNYLHFKDEIMKRLKELNERADFSASFRPAMQHEGATTFYGHCYGSNGI